MVCEVEEEWPSLGLVMEEKEEVVKAEEGNIVIEEEEMVSEVEEELPKINAIPGMDTCSSKSPSKRDRLKSQSMPSANDSSSLGELRFKDE